LRYDSNHHRTPESSLTFAETKFRPLKTIIEPFKIKSVEPLYFTTEEERIEALQEADYNVFLLPSQKVIIDLLTDSGTSAMSSRQWAGIMMGDESYAGSPSFFRFEKTVQDIMGLPIVIPTHQGRGAEKILFTVLSQDKKTYISNTLFDTTRANIEFSGAVGLDFPCEEAKNPGIPAPFKGNMDVERLEKHLAGPEVKDVALVILTVTNNSGGGQPVSMENIRQTSEICKKYQVPFFLDACRFAENAWFIKQRENGYGNILSKTSFGKCFLMPTDVL
jgi:tryptophanase